MKPLIKILKVFLYIFALIVSGIIVLLVYSSMTVYSPADKETLFQSENPAILSDTLEFNVLTWNIGYAGLGDNMDFFYDGGKQMRTSRYRTIKNLAKITRFLKEHSYFDFILLQEVDTNSKRSYFINSFDSIQGVMPNATQMFGVNYKVKHVPVPIFNPMGKVNSGISTISHAVPSVSERYSFPVNYPWPQRLFNLRRCFIKSRYPLSNGKELIIINTHKSAFDDGNIRAKQMEYLKGFLESEYNAGNYVIAGGDWNQCPPDFSPKFCFNHFDTIDYIEISKDYLSEWQWVFDDSVPTNRRLNTLYDPVNSLTTVIDFFLISPNVEVISVEAIQLDFRHSDHNPVKAKFRLKPKESNNY